jgi:hypothetical protein
MSEKPVAHDMATATDIVREYEGTFAPAGLVWAVLENYRFETGVVRAGSVAGSSDLVGNIALVEVRVHNPMPAASRFAKHDRTNQLLEGGCHFTAAMRALAEGGKGVDTNPIISSTGATSHISSYMPSPDTLAASYAFASGALATLCVSFAINRRRFEVMATGTRGSVLLERGVRDGKHGYRVLYESHIDGGADRDFDEFYPFDGIAAAVGEFGERVAVALRAKAAGAVPALAEGDDRRLSPAAALIDIALIDAIMNKPTL